MISQLKSDASVRTVSVFAIAGAMLVSTTAMAVDVKTLADEPQSSLGEEVELPGYCLKGGVKGDVVGYECTTDGTVYVTIDEIAPDTAAKTLGEKCDAAAVTERSADCRATLRFKPHSYTTSSVIEPGKSITVLNADKADVSF